MKKGLFLILSLLLCTSCVNSSSSSSSLSEEYKIYDTYVSNIKAKDGLIVQPFNTMVTLRTFCEKDSVTIFPVIENEIQRLHKLFDRYNEYLDENNQPLVNLKIINDSYGSGTVLNVDQDIIDLLQLSIDLCSLTEGYFNPTLGVLIDSWNYVEKEDGIYNRFSPYCMEEEDIKPEQIEKSLNAIVPYNDLKEVIVINDDNNTVEFKKYNDIDKIVISLGAIAKGYAIEKAKNIISSYNVSAMIDGGSSSSYGIGKNPNPERDYWIVGIAAPYKSIFGLPAICNVKFTETYTLSVSGDYESSFYFIDENGNKILRHHLLNPHTGYPENFYRVLSLWSQSRSDVLDGLSTALFSIDDSSKMMNIIKNVENYFNIDIEILIEKEIDVEKIDVYVSKDYRDSLMSYNQAYFNSFVILEKEGEGNE